MQEKNKDLILPLRLFSTSEMARVGGMTAGVGGIHGRNVCLEQARNGRNLSFHLLKEFYGETQCKVYNRLAEYPL